MSSVREPTSVSAKYRQVGPHEWVRRPASGVRVVRHALLLGADMHRIINHKPCDAPPPGLVHGSVL